MGSLKIEVFPEKNLTVNKLTGKISITDLMQWLENYTSGKATKFLLWDITEANVSELSVDDLKVLAKEAQKHSKERAGEKMAIVSRKVTNQSLGKMFGVLAEIEGINSEIKNFETMKEAEEWFGF